MRSTHFIPKPDRVVFAVIGIFCFFSLCLIACHSDKIYEGEKILPRTKPIFNKENKALGEATFTALVATVREARSKNIDLKDSKVVKELSYKHGLESLRSVNLIDEETYLRSRSMPASEAVLEGTMEDKSDVSKTQTPSVAYKKVMSKVQQAVEDSDTYWEFSSKIAKIVNDIPTTVPKEEQATAQRHLTLLYHTMEALSQLEIEGLLENKSKTSKAGFFSFLMMPRNSLKICTCCRNGRGANPGSCSLKPQATIYRYGNAVPYRAPFCGDRREHSFCQACQDAHCGESVLRCEGCV